jgi:hypothetical protein
MSVCFKDKTIFSYRFSCADIADWKKGDYDIIRELHEAHARPSKERSVPGHFQAFSSASVCHMSVYLFL